MKIFVVEDDKFYNKLIEHHLKLNPEFEVQTFFDGQGLLDKLHENPKIISLDFSLPDMTGHEVLAKVKNYDPKIEVIIISGQDDIPTAIKLLKQGAYDYITKDENIKERLINTIHKIIETDNLRSEVTNLKTQITEKYNFSKAIIGDSKAIRKVFSLIEKAISVQNMTVSIRGDTGTGKELVARTVHYNSIRKDKAFVAVNMGAIPRELVESELFGYEKGAFTGAYARSIGKFEEANGGTIFFDEVAELNIDLQVKLLRAIQEREITRVGGNNTIKVDSRIITATNKNLQEEVKKGTFREDLYYRLLGLPIILPPLSERENDIILLASFFLKDFCSENKLERLEFSPSARNKLLTYHYPGNVRELKAIVELSAVMSENLMIEDDHIMFTPTNTGLDLFSKDLNLRDFEAKIIQHYLEKNNNNVVLVAKKLDIGKSKIYNMIKNGEI
ncbi:MAG: sigma-54-dependent Fis family transcriptional regulator [Bacteroidetes bacterium]|jgi:DNA-binding NtrC family response regulator|nr:sigma-54-dependent Fis family transcriptional regulator [Bacteroidota bacterium]MBT3747825.1 sigma-54-dependent Fis family transcriptional regulator [Bacteroidota bacterium]MBT4399304.1 sigma-54-dependent Fis family transcriptional regulator [Bacteroidota bacterium]MBT4411901.1 sigma-54-dependent Fis family transcriptional regulator [Bacteroidota bacterium]MBT7091866.1 sigma-54-dependent Fis family transcriptional regulator [Bacteroidota bacterium]